MTSLRSSARRGFIPEFDGLRGVAILAVMIYHFFQYKGPGSAGQALHRLASIGWAGVDVFFVISGFLITGILLDSRARPKRWRHFFIRRSLRIFPLYYLVMAAVTAVGIGATALGLNIDHPAVQTVDRAWVNFLYLTNFWVAWAGKDSVPMDIAWSLAIEEQFYLVFPFVVWHLSRRNLLRALVLSVLLAPVIRTLTWWYSGGDPQGPYVLPWCRMDSLTMGGLLVFVLRDGSDSLKRALSQAAIPLSVGALALLISFKRGTLPLDSIGYSLTAAATGAWLVRVLSGDAPILSRVLRNPALMHIGKVSYGLYLLHVLVRFAFMSSPVGSYFTDYRADLGLGLLRVTLLVGLSLLAATASWTYFERPVLKLKNRWAPNSPSLAQASDAGPPEGDTRA